jgi:fibronectin type 3 domain-containing protein
MDANTTYVAVSNTSSQPVPAVVNTVGVQLIAATTVRLDWSAVGSATAYRVYRSNVPTPGTFNLIGTTSELFYDDHGQGTLRDHAFYLVRGANACGAEGP